MSMGSFGLSSQEREQLWRNPKLAGPLILKLFGDKKTMSLNDLRSITGLPADLLQDVLDQLLSNRLIESNAIGGNDAKFNLTERGDKARFFIAS